MLMFKILKAACKFAKKIYTDEPSQSEKHGCFERSGNFQFPRLAYFFLFFHPGPAFFALIPRRPGILEMIFLTGCSGHIQHYYP
jgi:hypothetical protein